MFLITGDLKSEKLHKELKFIFVMPSLAMENSNLQ